MFTFGSYNFEDGGLDDGRDDRLERQLALLASLDADAWAFQECKGWTADGGYHLHRAERVLGMRGFLARSSHHGCDVAVFARESSSVSVSTVQHEEGPPYWHAVARVAVVIEGTDCSLISAHLAPSSPALRLVEAEAFALVAKNPGAVFAGGDWNALPASDPVPAVDGHADAPRGYREPGGRELGNWVAQQKAGHASGVLPADRAAALDELGITWSAYEASWQRGLEHATAYHAEHGHLNPPTGWACTCGFRLYPWLDTARAKLADGRLDPGRTSQLQALGFTGQTNTQAAFQRGLNALDAYIAEHGNAAVPGNYITPDGYRLGNWISSKRTIGDKLPADARAALNERGMIWDTRAVSFARGLEALDAYIAAHGDAAVPGSYVAPDGYRLGRWLINQRVRHRRDPGNGARRLSAAEEAALTARGISWNPRAEMHSESQGADDGAAGQRR